MAVLSANLGFLWTDLSLPDGIRAAKKAGFDAVECHWPYSTPQEDVGAALRETGLPMLGLNTVRGNVEKGENGLSALVGREGEAKAAIDQALAYAKAIRTPNIHVMAGFAQGEQAHDTFIKNLQYASMMAQQHGITVLIEPLNHHDAPGYFLQGSEQAKAIIGETGCSNIKLMFDCYHLQIMEGDISRRLTDLKPIIGHVQIASVPDRAEPDGGEIDYRYILALLKRIGYEGAIGAEYRPSGKTDLTLGWMSALV